MESIRVLVVEDDQDINNLLCTILRDGGYESQAAFSGSEGVLTYTNAQGEKRLPFGLCGNRFCDFPQQGYADQVGSVPGGRLYRCAASAAWKDARTLWLKVQVIDDYLGNMDALFTFSEDGRELSLTMRKTAEDFLDEYEGDAAGRRQ